MEPEMIIFTIPLLGILLGFFGVWTHHKQRMVKLEIQLATAAKAAGGPAPEQTREVKELQERVRVLERIVTEGGYDLATRIEALRDDRGAPVEARPEIERLS